MPKNTAANYYAASHDFQAALERLDAHDPLTIAAVLENHRHTMEMMHINAHQQIGPNRKRILLDAFLNPH